MKLAWLQQDLEGARRGVAVLLVLLIGSMLANLVLAGIAARLSDRERIVIVPPVVHKSFWLDAERVSGEYLEQMAYFLMQLVLNVTPQNVDHQAKVLLQYAAPGAYGELRTVLATAAERLKRDSATTVFSARDLMVDEAAMRVAVRGQLTTFVSDRRVSETSRAYLIEFQYTAGRIYLKTFRETATNDPLENKPALGAPAPGA